MQYRSTVYDGLFIYHLTISTKPEKSVKQYWKELFSSFKPRRSSIRLYFIIWVTPFSFKLPCLLYTLWKIWSKKGDRSVKRVKSYSKCSKLLLEVSFHSISSKILLFLPNYPFFTPYGVIIFYSVNVINLHYFVSFIVSHLVYLQNVSYSWFLI